MKDGWETVYLHSIKVFPTDHLFIRKGLKDTFTVVKDLNQVIKFNLTNKGTK